MHTLGYVPTTREAFEWTGLRWGRQISCVGFESETNSIIHFVVVQPVRDWSEWHYRIGWKDGSLTDWISTSNAYDAFMGVKTMIEERGARG